MKKLKKIESTAEGSSTANLKLEIMSKLLVIQPISVLPTSRTAGDDDLEDDRPLSFIRPTRASTSRAEQKKPPPKKKVKEKYMAMEEFLPRELKDH